MKGMVTRAALGYGVALTLGAAAMSGAQNVRAVDTTGDMQVTCAPERPTVLPGASLTVRAWTSRPDARALRYTWTTDAGRISASGPTALWDFTDVSHRREEYVAEVSVARDAVVLDRCAVRVIVRRPPIDPTRGRETGWSLLPLGVQEAQGYGLYSYLVLGSPPIGTTVRERYLKVLEAYLELVPDVTRLSAYFEPHQLNVAYVPVTAQPSAGQMVSAQWALQHYDYARARRLLSALPGDYRHGPYIIAALRPLGDRESAGGLLLHDLSAITPDLAAAWMKVFLNQAAQERFWDARTTQHLGLRVRLAVAVMAEGLPEVQKGLESWIRWVR